MITEIINALKLGAAFMTIFVLAELLFHRFRVKAEVTRKFTHLASGLLSLSFPLLFSSHWIVMLLCAVFSLFLLLSYRYGFMPSINAVGRFTHGSLLFPVVVYVCFYVSAQNGMPVYFYLPILILSISDPLAALSGKSIPLGPYLVFGHSKTLMGSAAFFASAFACTSVGLWQMNNAGFLAASVASLLIASATTLAEAVTHKGYDNLLIPVAALASLFITQQLQLI